MSDAYKAVRELSFSAIAPVLGIDLSRFKYDARHHEWVGACPIHGSQNNKTCFRYNDDGRFHCFSQNCKGRGSLDLAMQVLKIGFKEAVERLSSIPAPTAQSPNVEAPAAPSEVLKPILKDTWRNYQVPCEWLEKRVPDASVREAYQVFCYNNPSRKSAYSGRVMIPVKDTEGTLFGYLGRSFADGLNTTDNDKDVPKYLFPKNLPKAQFLFGAYELSRGLHLESVRRGEPHNGGLPLKVVYLVESAFSVLHFASLGLPCVASYGWSVSENQVQLLSSLAKGVVFLPDANKHVEAAGQLGLLAQSLWLRFPPLPDGIDDPEHLSLEQILSLTAK